MALKITKVCDFSTILSRAAKEGDHKSKGWPSSAYGTVKLGLICGTKLLGEAVQKDRPQDDILIMAVSA